MLLRIAISSSNNFSRPGSHCPLMHQPSHSEKRDEHHCTLHEQSEKKGWQELRCHCCPSPLLDASPDVSATRFFFPRLTTDKLSPYVTRLYVSYHFLISTVTLVPPDPPPRTALFAFRQLNCLFLFSQTVQQRKIAATCLSVKGASRLCGIG